MVARASYGRSRSRGYQTALSIFGSQDALDQYNAKFDTLSYYWPVAGDLRRAYDDIQDLRSYMDYRGMSWKDVDHRKVADHFAPTVGKAFAIVSKNIYSLYR